MQKWRAYLVGALGGAAVLTIIFFATGIMVTSGKSEERAQQAAVDVQALICEGLARAYLDETGDQADLTGYNQRDARDELARRFAPILPGNEAADSAVVKACASKFA